MDLKTKAAGIYAIPKTKKGKPKGQRRVLGAFEFDDFVKKTYPEFIAGASIKEIFERHRKVRRQESDYEIHLINHFFHYGDISNIKDCGRIASLKQAKHLQMGFLYVIRVNDKIKFGKTKNLNSRMASYKSHSGINPKLLDHWFGIGYSDLERDMKNSLRGKGITTEWFDGEYEKEVLEKFKTLLTTTNESTIL